MNIPQHIRGKALTLIQAFGLEGFLAEDGSNQESLLHSAYRSKLQQEALHRRARRRYHRNQMAQASRRANRGK